MNWYKRAYVDGEWWITNTGEVLFADGDVGDYNHEAYVLEQIIGNHIDLDAPESPDMYNFQNMADEDLTEIGFSPEEIQVIHNRVDAREYAMKNWSWVRVSDRFIQTWYLTSQILSRIANGLFDAFGGDVYTEKQWVIHVTSNGKIYENIPYEVMTQRNPMALRDYQMADLSRYASNNWYKRAKQLEPWQMTREEYESIPYPPLKPNQVFYVDVYGSKIEVIQNPTGSDMRQMSKEVLREHPNISPGTPKLRSTQDADGNKYYWKAYDASHAHIEPAISKMVGSDLNQNAARPLHSRIIYDALKNQKPIPDHVLNEFSQQYPNVVQEYSNQPI